MGLKMLSFYDSCVITNIFLISIHQLRSLYTQKAEKNYRKKNYAFDFLLNNQKKKYMQTFRY